VVLRGGYRVDTPGGYKEITVTINEEVIGSHRFITFPLLRQ